MARHFKSAATSPRHFKTGVLDHLTPAAALVIVGTQAWEPHGANGTYVVPVAAMPFPCVGTTRSRATILVSRSTEIARSSSAIPLGTSVMFTATTVGNLPYRTDGVPGWGHKDSRVGRFEWVPEMRILPAVRPSTPGVEAVAWPPIRGSQPQSSAPCPV